MRQNQAEIEALDLDVRAVTGRFAIRNYGCQMNVHDAEKMANLLYHAGFRQIESEEDADLLIIHTCSVREKAEHQLYSDVGALCEWKASRPGRLLGVGGCVAQQVGDRLLTRFEHLDFVFGTHSLRFVPAMIRAAAQGKRTARTGETVSIDRFEFPERHSEYPMANPGRAFLTVMEGCDMFCSFCIVPRTRGREISRPAASILEEASSLAHRGVAELVLLGQTVNAYGRHDQRRDRFETSGTMPFPQLLRELAMLPGIEQLRYTSPHPLFFDDALIAAHGDLPELCPHVHLPLQSGSDRILEAMCRRYTMDDYLEIVAKLRAVRPDIALTTDLIVGFPGETDADFEATLRAMLEVGFVDSYAFKYSPRPNTASEKLGGGVGAERAQARLERVQDVQRELTVAAYGRRVGSKTMVRLDGESRRGNGQWRGRDPYHRVVNLDLPEARTSHRVGDRVEVTIVGATPHSLIGEVVHAEACGAGVGKPAQELLTIV